MLSSRHVLAVLALMVLCTGCAVIAGREDPNASGRQETQVRLNYVETLRNQASLRGEGFRDAAYTAGTPTTLQRPNAVFADAFRVYVADQTQPPRVFIFDRGDRTAGILPVPAPPADGKLLNPTGISVDIGNIIYVSDAQQGRVFAYDRNGMLLLAFGKAGDLAYPMGIAVDRRRNRIYIADAHAHLVRAYSLMGERLFDIGGDGSAETRFKYPLALTLDRDGRLYILDRQSKQVVLADPEGKQVKRITLSSGTPGEPLRPQGIAVDSAGHIYVADSVNNHILIFGPDGGYLTTWGKTGVTRGDFWTPQGLFIDERDLIYIADQTNGRVQVYQFLK